LVAQEAAADAMMNLFTDTTPCNDPDSIDDKESLVSRLVAVKIQGAGSVSAGFRFASPRNHVSTLHAFAGFKSYAGEVEVRGLEDFTCIIGANGAGKSVVVSRQQ